MPAPHSPAAGVPARWTAGPAGAAATAWWLILIGAAGLVLGSIAWSPSSNWTVRTAVAAFCLLAIARPAAALLITIALAGFGSVLAHLAGAPPLRFTEVLVVCSLAGCGVRALLPGPLRDAMTGRIPVPVALFALATVASTIVWLRVHQVETMYPSEYLQSLLQALSRDYFFEQGGFRVVLPAAVILQGLSLYVAIGALGQVDPGFFKRALRMLAVGGAGLGILSIVRLAEITLRNPQVIEALRATSDGLRISPQIPDYIAAGSYFALCWIVTLGLALASPGRRILWIALGIPLLAALYLTGSRSVIAAALVGVAALVVIVAWRGASPGRGVLALGGLALVVMVASYPWLTGRDLAGVMAQQSLSVRTELARTGLRVMAERPLFGVGLDRFHLRAGQLASPRLNELFPVRKNPHNDLLRFGAELGLTGLVLFLWILASAGRRIWEALRLAADPRLAALAGGLVAFLTTSMVSNPLMVREVSYVFWIALGLAASQGGRPGIEDPPRRTSRGQTFIPLLVGVLLLFSIPFRAKQEVAAVVDFRRVSYGFFEWNADMEGIPFRWSSPRATFFVDGRARIVDIPLSGAPLPSGEPQQVELLIDGRLADRLPVPPEWQRLRTTLPPTGSATRRIDLVVSPPWIPANVHPDSEDRRELGVRVGPIVTVLQP